MNIEQIPVAMMVWTQRGCPACEDYLPVFRRVAERYETCMPVLICDVDRFPHAADAFGVASTPTTFVSRYGQRSFRFIDGDAPEYAIESLFQSAIRGLDCQVESG